MTDIAELELGLFRADHDRYALRCRFWKPDSSDESDLGLSAPAPVAFDLGALRALQASPEAYGQRLKDMLFAEPAARIAFARARDRVPLRLRLYIDPAAVELQALRWETLADPDRGDRLCADENIYFSRFLSGSSLQSFKPAESPRLRALVVIASPSNMDKNRFAALNVAAERERAEQSLTGMDVTYLASGGQATSDRLVAALRPTSPQDGGCDVLYLVAHGWKDAAGEARLLLEKPDGTGRSMLVKDLMDALSGLARKPLLAVLVSCQSAGTGVTDEEDVLLALGPRLAALGVPAVLAMHGSVTQTTIARFLPVFFGELRFHGQIDRALAAARAVIRDQTDWWMPVLYSRLRDNQLLKPSPLAQDFERLPFEPETVLIPSGAFKMGRDPADDMGSPAWEQPCHSVDLPAYRIGVYPVTNRQYAEFVREVSGGGQYVNPESGWDGQVPPPGRDNYPIQGVTWYQAMKYCEWLSGKTGRHYTLPTEAQWEKAARGTDGRLYPWGSDWQENRCNADTTQTTPINRYPAQSPYGLYDLVGNLREWTLTLWGARRGEPDYAYPWAEDGRNNPNANVLVRRVFRGGAGDTSAEMTCTARGGFMPDKSGAPGRRHGFRVVMLEK